MLLVLIAGECAFPDSTASLWSVQQDVSRERLAKVAVSLAFRSLHQHGYVESLEAWDDRMENLIKLFDQWNWAGRWTEEKVRLQQLLPKSGNVIEALLYRGEITRAEAAEIVGSERQGRRVVRALVDQAVLTSEQAVAATTGVPGIAGVTLSTRSVSRSSRVTSIIR